MLVFGIPDFSRETEWAITEVRFEFLGGTYRGRGLLKWDPGRGFHLDAFLDRHGPPLPQRIGFGKFGVAQPCELRRVWMSFNGGRGLSAPIHVAEHLELVRERRLSADIPSVLFRRPARPGTKPGKVYGSAVLNVGRGLAFPDSVERKTTIEEKRIACGVARHGIRFDAEDMELTGILDRAEDLKVDWALGADKWSKLQAWTFGHALADALSFVGGRTVRLLDRRMCWRNRECIERGRSPDVQYLKLLSMAPRQSPTPNRIDKEQFISLTRFFLRGGKEADVARRMCAQMAEAARQQTWAARELLCANVLDAALRTLMNCPYQKKDSSTHKIDPLMDRFRATYLSQGSWEGACRNVLQAYHRLRHRNAHPDWLTGHGGGMSDATLEESLDDMIRVAWFYGYMILAMAGFQNLEPRFPGPHKNWGPLMTMTTAKQG